MGTQKNRLNEKTYAKIMGKKIYTISRDKNISILYLSCRTSPYNFHLSCKHMLLSFKSVCNKEHIREKYVIIQLSQVILPKALVLQDECFGKNYSFFLDFTHNYKRTSGVFVP